jgi:hypothetical protein
MTSTLISCDVFELAQFDDYIFLSGVPQVVVGSFLFNTVPAKPKLESPLGSTPGGSSGAGASPGSAPGGQRPPPPRPEPKASSGTFYDAEVCFLVTFFLFIDVFIWLF